MPASNVASRGLFNGTTWDELLGTLDTMAMRDQVTPASTVWRLRPALFTTAIRFAR